MARRTAIRDAWTHDTAIIHMPLGPGGRGAGQPGSFARRGSVTVKVVPSLGLPDSATFASKGHTVITALFGTDG